MYLRQKVKIVSLLFIAVIVSLVIKRQTLPPNLIRNFNSCSICIQTEICFMLQQPENYELTWPLYIWENMLNAHNVYRGKFNQSQVFFKKFLELSEIKYLDKEMIELHEMFRKDQFVGAKGKVPELFAKKVIQLVKRVTEERNFINAGRCLSPRILNLLLTNYQKVFHDTPNGLFNTIMLLMLNPEPLILSAFKKELDYPLPNLLGICNQMLVESDEGQTLRKFKSHSFLTRIKVSIGLVEAVKKLTFNVHNVMLYITDPSLDNFVALRKDDKYIISLVDVENVLIVDQISVLTSQSEDEGNTHLNDGSKLDFDTEISDQDFIFSIDDLCTYYNNVHNIYAVCKTIFNPKDGNFLHNSVIHASFAREYEWLMELVSSCSDESQPPHLLNEIAFQLYSLEKKLVNLGYEL